MRQARTRLRAHVAGLLCVLACGGPLAQPMSAVPVPAPVPASFFGMHMNMGRRADFGWPSIPFGSWRLIHPSTVWSGLEPSSGQWRWETLDRAVADAEQRGVEPFLTLGFTPDWAARKKAGAPVPKEGHAAFPPRDPAEWRRYVKAVAERYRGRVRWFELWNEPHFSETDRVDYGFGMADMVVLARVAHETLREVDPDNRLVSFSPPGAERGIRRLELFFERGGGAHVDAIGFHFYTTPPAPEAVATLATRLRAVANQHGLAGKPIWNTEAGYLTEDPEHAIAAGPINRQGDRYLTQAEAAAFVPRTLLMALHAGIERWYHYAWAIRAYSLSSDRGRAPSPAGIAYATTQRWLLGSQFRGCVQPTPTAWRCQLTRPSDGQRAEVVWSTAAGGESAPGPGAATWIETIQGETHRLDVAKALALDGTPVLLKSDPAAWRGAL